MRASNNVRNSGAAIELEDAQATLPIPTLVTHGASVAAWSAGGEGVVGSFDLLINCAAALVLTNAILYGWDGTTWFQVGPDLDASITLAASTEGYRIRRNHSPDITRYALVGTVSASTVTASVIAVVELTSGK